MITNLPQVFPVSKLEHFVFGDVEATTDDLLDNDMCICRIRPVDEFLKGRKSIVIGERGTGKTALFRLVSSNKLSFTNDNSLRQLIIPIDEDLQFTTIKEIITSKIKITSNTDCLKYRFVWEIFLFYRILVCLEENCKLDDNLQDIVDKFREIFGNLKKKNSLIELLLSQKKTIGC